MTETARRPEVSVVVPTCNRASLLREALASIRALEGADLTFEIIVGDNGEPGPGARVAAEFGAIHVPVDRPGAGAARNVALLRASAPYVAFLDDDDVWMPGHVRGHLRLLKADPDLGIVFGQIVTTSPELEPVYGPWPADLPQERGTLLRRMMSGYFPQIGATLVRRSLVDDIGLFDEALLGDQDWDWQIRAVRRHGAGFVAAPCVHFRQRPAGTFDSLIARRIRFTRLVFRRHAPALGVSPLAALRLYFGTVQGYYDAFSAAAQAHAARGDRRAALRALASAFRLMPHRAIKDAIRPTHLRAALLATAAAQASRPLAAAEPETR
ncbi:glycosyltransferase family A protein [Methylobacterium sp. NEAU K]|uniref:glycosyltransferase family 2 protein n=1 Tax=Methylobacterium sp. NEAU K TaxID=3064946 RepID=UPI00273401CD|nr:glycosyltransferase family A protein [Methylobacterium sp. NEAU K]MDP4005840.1 glycosyltransferase family A protein [Methylobacterium sp. NEAU K]